ncbi:MAG: hypothetical protein DHS20C14_09160 [Phycisphaeraceae bacterium]|nr:MAG: hypothetical protein DHS20C14_09160 [Phycisphaeraceae bacterium]
MKHQIAIGFCLATITAAPLTGCRVERTRGQRHQVRALDAVLQAEADRLSVLSPSADPEGLAQDYRLLVEMQSDLINSMVRSASAEPIRVQQAEDDLILLADEARGLESYRSWSADTQLNFERQFWRNRLQPWQMWRGPGWQTNREDFTVRPGS